MGAAEKGFLAASGEIIVCLDADCRVPSDWLKKAEKYLQKSDVIAASVHMIILMPLYSFDELLCYSNQFFIQLSLHFCILFFVNQPPLLSAETVLSKIYFRKIGGFDTSVKFWGEDVMTALRLAKEGRVIFSSQLKVLSSHRRFQKEGSIKTSLRYFLNYLSIYFYNKPYVREKD